MLGRWMAAFPWAMKCHLRADEDPEYELKVCLFVFVCVCLFVCVVCLFWVVWVWFLNVVGVNCWFGV